MTDGALGSDAALQSFLDSFFDGSFPGKDWHHREHVIMAGWHLLRYPEAECIDRIREAVKRYNLSQGGQNTDTSGYHETLTVLWIRLLAHGLATQPSGMDELERLRRLADEFGPQAKLFTQYYSYDVVGSTPARLHWMEPDLRPLPTL